MIYRIIRLLVLPVFKVIFWVKVEGLHHIPRQGAAIVCSNHVSAWDPPLVACMLPRQVFFMAKAELFKTWAGNVLFHALGAFPVKRNAADRQAIRAGLDNLNQGRLLGIFPEGTRSRSGELLEPMTGAGMFALKTGVPVIPIAIRGPYKVFRPVYVRIGAPMHFSPAGEKIRAKDMADVSLQIMNRISSLLETV